MKGWRTTAVLSAAAGVLWAFVSISGAAGDGTSGTVSYPEDYRRWTHVKSMVIQEGHELFDAFGGIHHVYANREALDALRAGGPHGDGAVLVFDLLEAEEAGGAIVEGPRKFIGVMRKDAKAYPKTGGWGFEAFKGDGRERMVTDPENACFSCHEVQKGTDYVFSTYRK